MAEEEQATLRRWADVSHGSQTTLPWHQWEPWFTITSAASPRLCSLCLSFQCLCPIKNLPGCSKFNMCRSEPIASSEIYKCLVPPSPAGSHRPPVPRTASDSLCSGSLCPVSMPFLHRVPQPCWWSPPWLLLLEGWLHAENSDQHSTCITSSYPNNDPVSQALNILTLDKESDLETGPWLNPYKARTQTEGCPSKKLGSVWGPEEGRAGPPHGPVDQETFPKSHPFFLMHWSVLSKSR